MPPTTTPMSATLKMAKWTKVVSNMSVTKPSSARCGANVVSVHHDRGDVNMAINSCFLKLGLETRDKAQIEQIKEELTRAGFHLVSERV